MKKENFFNLIERILILGPVETELEKYLNKNNSNLSDLSNINSKILEEYRSINLIDENDIYTENINMENGLISKTLYQVSKVICLISPIDIFKSCIEILKNIFSIISNYKNIKENLINQSQLAYVYIKDDNKNHYKNVIKEYKLLEFYFAFLLNSLKLKKEERSYYIQYIGNNIGKKTFLKFHINSKSFLKMKDYDISMIMDYINVENLIKLYIGLLMEYKIIIIFENYETINQIIFSLLSILFPLKWKLPIISYALEALIDSLEAPFGMICGIHTKFLPILSKKIEQKLMGDETLVFNLNTNSFIYLPEEFPELPKKITNELKSNYYLILSEKLSINNRIEFNNAEYSNIFPECVLKHVNPLDYLNLKFNLIFINCFMEILRNLEEFIDPVNLDNLKKKANSRIIISDLIDLNKLYSNLEKNNNSKFANFLDQMTKTIMFTHFFEKYLTRSDKNHKYKSIKSYLKLMHNQQDNYKSILNDYNKEKIRNKMINFYDYKYISLETALKKYLEKAETTSFTNINKSTPSNKLLWNKLDLKKINIFYFSFEMFLFTEQDECTNKIIYKKILSELLKKRDSKAYELGEEENVDRPMINNNKTKLKSHLEIIQANKRKKKEFPSLSLDDKTLYDIYESGLSGINSNFTSKNKVNIQKNFENITNSEFRPGSKEPKFLKDNILFNEKNHNFQNIYVNNINITNNYNNMTINTNGLNTVFTETKENPLFSNRKFDFEQTNNYSQFNDLSNFTYSEKPSNKSSKKDLYTKKSSDTRKPFSLESDKIENYINYNNNVNLSNSCNFADFNIPKKNFVYSDMRNSLNLSNFEKNNFSPLRDSDTFKNNLYSINNIFCESGDFKEIKKDRLNNAENILLNHSKSDNNDITISSNLRYNHINFQNKNFSENKINMNEINKNISSFNVSDTNANTNINNNKVKLSLSISDKNNGISIPSNNNKINLKLIPNAKKVNYPNNSPSKNSIFLDFMTKSKNMNTQNNSVISNDYNNKPLENESFRNEKMLNYTNQISNRTHQQINSSDYARLGKKFKLNNGLNENRTFLENSSSRINNSNFLEGNFENLGVASISPTKKTSEPICISSKTNTKNFDNNKIPDLIKLQINSSIGTNNNNSRKTDMNQNLEIIKRLSGDEDKDVFGD